MRLLIGQSGTRPQWLPQCWWRAFTTHTPLLNMLSSRSHWRSAARRGPRPSAGGAVMTVTAGGCGAGAGAPDKVGGAGAREPA